MQRFSGRLTQGEPPLFQLSVLFGAHMLHEREPGVLSSYESHSSPASETVDLGLDFKQVNPTITSAVNLRKLTQKTGVSNVPAPELVVDISVLRSCSAKRSG